VNICETLFQPRRVILHLQHHFIIKHSTRSHDWNQSLFFCTVHILSISKFYLIDVWRGMSLTKSIFSELVITHSNIRNLYMYLQPGDEPFFLVHLYGWYVPGWILPYIVLSIILDALIIYYRTNEKTTKGQNAIKPLHQKLFQWQLFTFAIHLL